MLFLIVELLAFCGCGITVCFYLGISWCFLTFALVNFKVIHL